MEAILNFIDGKFQRPLKGKFLDNYGPRDGKVYGQVADSGPEDIELAVQAAQQAFPVWRQLRRQERAACLNRLADLLQLRLEEFALAESRDQGKPVQLARTMDIPRAIDNFRFFAGAILHQEESAFQSSAEVLNYTLREPVGVAGLIAPWNLPLYLLTWKIAPALAAGNTVVAKPSELTPMTAYLLAQLCNEAGIPPGVCNIVFGRGETAGDALVAHPQVPLISFTGGTATAALIGRRAASHNKKLSFELGGKNPGVIFADCQLDACLSSSLRSSFLNQGEICLCTSRLLVEKPLFSRFLDDFVAAVGTLPFGDPLLPASFGGALVSRGHLEKVEGFVERAKQQGAEVLCGGERLNMGGELAGGYYYKPTVLLVEDPAAEIIQEEVFGPVVTVSPFNSYEDAITQANQTRYGLATSIWTQNFATAHRAARDIQAGQIWINTWMHRDLRVPFGGMKASGLGREGGRYSLEFYTEEKNVCLHM